MRDLKKKSIELQSDESSIDISSLIDVCFLLLIFFMVTSIIAPREADLDMQLPSPNGATADLKSLVLPLNLNDKGEVGVRQDSGEVEVLDSDVDSRELTGLIERIKLMKAAAGAEELLVQFDIADEASHQRFIDVMNCLSSMKITNVAFVDRS